MSTARHLLSHDESSALGSDSTWEPTGSARPVAITEAISSSGSNRLPAEGRILPILVYLASDFRPGPLDNGEIGLTAALQASASVGMAIVRWEPSVNRLQGTASKVDPLNPQSAPVVVDVESIRNWPGGVVLLASWPNDEQIVEAAEVVFTGPHGEPRIVRETSNARLHMQDKIAGYGSGLHYAARRRSS